METICMLIKLVLTSIQKQRPEMARRHDNLERQAKEEEVINKLLKILRSSLMSELPPSMSRYYKSDVLLRELGVSKTIG